MTARFDPRELGRRLLAALARLLARLRRVRSVAAKPAADPAFDSERARLHRFLEEELRLPLAALARLGARCSTAKESELVAVGRALTRESARLDVLLASAIELGLKSEETAPDGCVDVQELVEKMVDGHRALIEGLSIRLRVFEGARSAYVEADRGELLRVLSALFSDLIERVPRKGKIDLRVRELLGVVRIDCSASRTILAGRADRETILRAIELSRRLGGELWEVTDEAPGFGLTLPRPARDGEPPLVARRVARLVPAAT